MSQRGLQCLSTRFWTKLLKPRNFSSVHLNNPDNKTLHIPTFEFPWPSACSPYAERVEEETVQWGNEHNLIPNAHYQDRVKRSRYGWLTARCYPQADYLLLRAMTDYNVWAFLADDVIVDRVETIGPHTISNLTSMIDIIDFNRLSDEPTYGKTALLDVCQRFRAQLSEEQYQRVANGIRLWDCSVALQILMHIQPQSVGLKQYETIRHYIGSMNSSLDLVDIANGAMLPANVFYRPEVQQLRRCANNVVVWTNDIYSLNIKMLQPGHQHNMVSIYADQGHSLQKAIDITAERTRKEINEFVRISNVIGSNCEKELTGYIRGLQDWMQGHQDWLTYDTQRYSSIFSKEDADYRGLLSNKESKLE